MHPRFRLGLPVMGGTLTAAVLVLVWAGVVQAHARLLWSDPVADSVVSPAPDHLTLGFSENLARGTSITVTDADGNDVTAGGIARSADQATVMLGAIGPGLYTVAWTSVSADDGHEATGSFQFTVGE
jgi:methionine-rich copper-binding protein CopC